MTEKNNVDEARGEIATLKVTISEYHITGLVDWDSHQGYLSSESIDQILNLSFNGYTIADLIELAEKATEDKKVGVYWKNVELPENPFEPKMTGDSFCQEHPQRELLERITNYAQQDMFKEGYRKIIKEE